MRKCIALLAVVLLSSAAYGQNYNVSGYDSGPVNNSTGGSVANSSHAAGQSVGSLMTVPIGRPSLFQSLNSGIVTNFMLVSPGGSTGSYVVRIWQKNPVNTTCTDNSAFVSSATDDLNLITSPFSVTASAPAVTTGDSKTYGLVSGMTVDFKNADSPPTPNLYVCVVTVATDTADQNTTIRVMLSGPQN